LVRLCGASDAHDFFNGRHFQVEPTRYDLAQDVKIAVLNMSPIFAQMNRDAIRAAKQCQDGGGYGIRLNGTSRLTHRGDVVDIHTKADHGGALTCSRNS